MNVCICGASAVEFWRTVRIGGPQALLSMGVRPLPEFVRDWRACRVTGRLPEFEAPSAQWVGRLVDAPGTGLSAPVDLMVSRGTPRGNSLVKQTHPVPAGLPDRAVVQVADHVFATSPEWSLADEARRLSRAETARIACEFCGSYATDPGLPRGFAQVAPLVTRDELAWFCSLAGNLRGAASMLDVLLYSFDDCASPPEASMVILLCMPRRHGGHGLPRAGMNLPIRPQDREARRIMDRDHYVGDAVWPEARLVIEYDSRAEHTAQASVAHDSIRKMALEAQGWRVLSVTPAILSDEHLFTKVARAAARQLGVRVRSDGYGAAWAQRNREARRDLLDVPARWHRLSQSAGSPA